MRFRRTRYYFFLAGALLGIGALLLAAYLSWLIRTSHPALGVGAKVPSLSQEVKIEQDALGVPTIRGSSIEDIYRGQGWVTARDRFFQMDLLRRRSSGRLAEIFGKDVLELDAFHRKLGFAQVATKAAAAMKQEKRGRFQAYAEGVNAFIRNGPLPFEIRILGYQPDEWRVEDSLLVVLAMYFDLDFASQYLSERSLSLLYEERPKALADFLTPITGFLDTPVVPDAPLKALPIPPANIFDIRKERPTAESSRDSFEPAPGGSNAWALSGKFTHSGAPIVAGDPHLDLYAPNIWYRARLEGGPLRVTGVSLPGLPGIAIGSNGDLAWSITYPSGDTLDLVRLNEKGERRSRHEEIKIKGKKPQLVTVEETDWGPVLIKKGGIEYALQWTALDFEQLGQLDSTEILLSRNATEFLKALAHWKGPVSNIVFATRDGDIGWALAGNFPNRVGFDGRTAGPRDSHRYWKGYIPFNELPKVFNPPSGYIVSANQRMVPVKESTHDILRTANNLSCPDRAFRIRQLLEKSKGKWSINDSSSIQLDIYSPTAAFYADILRDTLGPKEKDAWGKEIYALIQNWDGLVTADTPVFPYIRAFRRQLLASMVEPLWGVEPLDETWLGDDRAAMSEWYYLEPVMKALIDSRPEHLLTPKYSTYGEAISDAAVLAAKSLVKHPEELKSLRWGKVNRTTIPHPFSVAFPKFIGKYFSMPDSEIGGTLSTPKVASLLYGRFHSASMRMVVDLGDANGSVFNQPGGQSGNFQSSHYSDQYSDWLKGAPTRFEPGNPTVIDLLRP